MAWKNNEKLSRDALAKRLKDLVGFDTREDACGRDLKARVSDFCARRERFDFTVGLDFLI